MQGPGLSSQVICSFQSGAKVLLIVLVLCVLLPPAAMARFPELMSTSSTTA